MVLRVVYAQKKLIVMDAAQMAVQTMIFVKIKNVRLQKDWHIVTSVKKIAGKDY